MTTKKPANDRVVGLARPILTAYAFTKSDYKTVIFPTLCYGILAAPTMNAALARLPSLTAWTWLFLLQFCAANQMYSQEEDAINKPYRPIPSGLISVQGTVVLRWILIPMCLALSLQYDVLYAGISLTVAFLIYNELHADNAWYTKNFLNAVGLVSWNVGAAKIAGADSNGTEWIIPYVSTVLISTTIHVQDFRDEAGDREQGRVTFPVVMPEFSRKMTFVLLLGWTFALSLYWDISRTEVIVYVMLGTYLATRVLKQRTVYEDKVSLRIYMLWLCVSQVLPFWDRHLKHWIQDRPF